MDFGMLPPEVNSARMYSGPGAGSMMAAAAAWDGLAADLNSTVASHRSAISGLTSVWQGPSSAMMAAAAAPFTAWLSSTAVQAEQAAAQARAAAAAYDIAFAATVPPPVIAANRAELVSLVATNIFGQNAQAIVANEAQYLQMWAQDAAAMYSYAAQSATASQLTPFNPPPPSNDPVGVANQAAAAGYAAATSTQTGLSQALQSLAAPAAAVDPPAPISTLYELAKTPFLLFEAVGKGITPATDVIISSILGLTIGTRSLNDIAIGVEPEIFAALPSGPLAAGLAAGSNAVGSAGSAVSADMGRAGLIGALAVPPTWAAATPTVRLAASMLQGGYAAAAPAVTAGSTGSVFGQMALASLAGGVIGGATPRAVNVTAVRGAGRCPGNGGDGKNNDGTKQRTPEKLKRVLAEMSQDPESLQHWYTDKEHLDSLLDQLSNKPGCHAVHLSKGNKTKPTPPRARWG